jgi:hypothetical protein
MEALAGALFVSGIRALLSAVIEGRELSRADLAELVGAAVMQLDSAQQSQHAALDRIEAKVDRLIVESFDRAYGSGRYSLEDARSPELQRSEQLAALDRAIEYFRQAEAGTTDVQQKAIALYSAGLSLALRGRIQASTSTLQAAWRIAFGMLDESAARFARPDVKLTIAQRLTYTDPGDLRVNARADAMGTVRASVALIRDNIQPLRRQLGVPPEDAPALLDTRNLGGVYREAETVDAGVIWQLPESGRVNCPDGFSLAVRDEVGAGPKLVLHFQTVFPAGAEKMLRVASRWPGPGWGHLEAHEVPGSGNTQLVVEPPELSIGRVLDSPIPKQLWIVYRHHAFQRSGRRA